MENTSSREVRTCHVNGKLCIKGIRSDFDINPATGRQEECRQWVHLYGKDPQSEKIIDQFDCSFAWVPTTTIETSQMVRQATASVDKTANVLNEVGHAIANVQKAIYIESVKASQLTGGNPSLNPPPEEGD